MSELLKYLQKLEPQFSFMQACNDGVWENACPLPTLSPISETVAVEYFYNLRDGRQAIFGLRYDPQFFVTSAAEFVSSCAQAPTAALAELLNYFGLDLARIQHLELGIAGFWKSVGSLTIESEQTKITNDQLLKNNKNLIILEFAFDQPQHWIGIQVSDMQGSDYILNQSYMAELIQLKG